MSDSTEQIAVAADLLRASEALEAVADEQYCYLTTTGRVTGQPHEVEIWYGARAATLYMLAGAGERADWVRNLRQTPTVRVRIAGTTFAGMARVIESDPQEQEVARTLLAAKYEGWRVGMQRSEWAATALPVAVDVAG